MENSITWTGSPDDQTAKIEDCVLRCEHLDFGLWWWSFLKDGDEILWGDCFSESEAKTAAINAMKEHLKEKE